MQELIKKLDLTDYIQNFESLMARKKDIKMEGDISVHYQMIEELDKHNFNPPTSIQNLDSQIMHIQKLGNLKIYEIYEFSKIIKYFLYLKRMNFEGKLGVWLDKIIIPVDIEKICSFFDDKGNLKDGIDEDFDLVKQAIRNNKEKIKQALYSQINSSKLKLYLVDSQVHLINDEECLLVRGGFNHVLKASVIERSNAGFFYVVPHSVSELKQKESDLKNTQEEIIAKIAKTLSSILNKNLMFIKFINKEFDRFDHYQARLFFAKSKDSKFFLPSKDNTSRLVEFKHPALVHAKPISVDFTKNVVMITGVNAGGKTMMLKSILSATFLSKYLIPFNASDKTKISHAKEILAILDDPQSVKNDISTFAGRMLEFSKLFTKRDVIVGVDEIELGTDSDEAASLFKVIIEELIEKNIKIIITTHHKRLAALLASNPNVELIAALYDEKNQVPTYEFLQGTIGKSYAFETALRYYIPNSVVNKAKEVYGDDKDKLNELIERSSELEREYQQKIQKLNSQIEQNEKLKKSLQETRESLDEMIADERSKLHREYKDVREEAKKAIKAKISQEGHRHLNISHQKAKEINVEKATEPEVLNVGDYVKYRGSKGTIVSLKGKQAFIENESGMKLKVMVDELKRSGNPPKIQNKPKTTVNITKNETGHVSLDLHGQRADEAIENLDKFISDALIAGFDEVLVYHGIGTGKLSFAVKKFLDSHPRVKGYTDAHPSQGGFGAKVIKL